MVSDCVHRLFSDGLDQSTAQDDRGGPVAARSGDRSLRVYPHAQGAAHLTKEALVPGNFRRLVGSEEQLEAIAIVHKVPCASIAARVGTSFAKGKSSEFVFNSQTALAQSR